MNSDPIISKDIMVGLLGRPLSDIEDKNYNLYLEIAITRLDDLLCLKLEELSELPVDIQLLIARCLATISQEQEDTVNHGVDKKQIEDFSISYKSGVDTPMVSFAKQNSATLDKYGQCQAEIVSGKVYPCEMFRCI